MSERVPQVSVSDSIAQMHLLLCRVLDNVEWSALFWQLAQCPVSRWEVIEMDIVQKTIASRQKSIKVLEAEVADLQVRVTRAGLGTPGALALAGVADVKAARLKKLRDELAGLLELAAAQAAEVHQVEPAGPAATLDPRQRHLAEAKKK